jgi:hypothetical protein
MFVFDGGVLAPEQVARIRPQTDERAARIAGGYLSRPPKVMSPWMSPAWSRVPTVPVLAL